MGGPVTQVMPASTDGRSYRNSGAGGLSIRVRYLAYAASMTALIAGRSSAVARRSPSGPAVRSGGVVVIGRPPGLQLPGSPRCLPSTHQITAQPAPENHAW